LKLLYTGRFKEVSTRLYVVMSWLVVFIFSPLKNRLPAAGLMWLLSGGILYSTGAILYSIRKIPFNHAIFHCLVLAGSACHLCRFTIMCCRKGYSAGKRDIAHSQAVGGRRSQRRKTGIRRR
jgi:channel protein (hemolysin III family)